MKRYNKYRLHFTCHKCGYRIMDRLLISDKPPKFEKRHKKHYDIIHFAITGKSVSCENEELILGYDVMEESIEKNDKEKINSEIAKLKNSIQN